jgi:serine/threonine protein kinase
MSSSATAVEQKFQGSAMNRLSWLDAGAVDELPEVLWEDGERRFCRVWRNGTDGARHECVAVVPVAEHPTPGSVSRLTCEYALRDHLDAAWSLRPLELVRERGRTVLVLEYHGGAPLDRLIAPHMEIGRFLRLAVALAAAIGRLHEPGVIHRDIRPANVLVDADDRIWLTGFGVASSDLYSLGVTLYQTLTGHIARRPAPPKTRFGDVPPQVSAIIMKRFADGDSHQKGVRGSEPRGLS